MGPLPIDRFIGPNGAVETWVRFDPAGVCEKLPPGAWIGFQLDGVLARIGQEDVFPRTPPLIGDPIPSMIETAKCLIKEGIEVRIISYRANREDECQRVRNWLKYYGLGELKVTSSLDENMFRLYHNQAIEVVTDEGKSAVQAERDGSAKARSPDVPFKVVED